ncbi:hypothetical protein [Candidatus Poriferisodalis sp.]|uniref:hypothetical protein n=1 Tax=Candidatus Poriferisodalis sp. TaxID=3101277 RepID=UPI003C6ED1C6
MSEGLEPPRRNPYLDEEAARPMRRAAARLVAVKSDGTRFGWGRMFVREVFKEIYWSGTFGLGVIVDIILLVLSDQPRTVADRVAGSTIVHVSALNS